MNHQEIVNWLKGQAEGLRPLAKCLDSSAEWVECLEHHAWLLQIKLEEEIIEHRSKDVKNGIKRNL